jgi:hypothetical protein
MEMLENMDRLFSRENAGKPPIPLDSSTSANGSKLAKAMGCGLMSASLTILEYTMAIDDASMALGKLNMDDPKEAARFAEYRRDLFFILDTLTKDITQFLAAMDRLSLHVARGPFVEQTGTAGA